jgi:hypothetical protein
MKSSIATNPSHLLFVDAHPEAERRRVRIGETSLPFRTWDELTSHLKTLEACGEHRFLSESPEGIPHYGLLPRSIEDIVSDLSARPRNVTVRPPHVPSRPDSRRSSARPRKGERGSEWRSGTRYDAWPGSGIGARARPVWW